MTIAITGASGALGRATAELVLQSVDPHELVLTSRRPETLADLAAKGVDVRRADFTTPESLAAAFAGVDRLLLISTDAVGARLDPQRAAIAAAVTAGVKHIIYTSVPEPVTGNPALVVEDHAGTEEAIRDSGLEWTVLRNNLYAHMQVSVIQQAAASGSYVSNTGDGATAYVTREDCAAAAAAVLTQDGHEGRIYDITGPEALRAVDMVTFAREISEGDVELVNVDDASYLSGLQAAGLPDDVARVVASFGGSTRGGYLASVSSAVADLTGRPPVGLADTISNTVRSASA